MTRRVLGMGPIGSELTGEGAGARLLPVEQLSGPEGGEGEAGPEQQPLQIRVPGPGRRALRLPPG